MPEEPIELTVATEPPADATDEIQVVRTKTQNKHLTMTRPDDQGSVERAPESITQKQKRTTLQLTAIMSMLYFSVFLAALDTTITTTAVPTIASYFNSSAGYTWVGSAYLLAVAATTPSWSKISDIFGRKPAMLASLIVFFLGSLLCGLATSMTMLIAGRAIQGTGGGGILLVTSVVTSDLFSMRSRGLIFSFMSLIYAVAAAVGPVLGGTFAELVDWRWCFYISLPCSSLSIIILTIFLDLKSPRTPLIAGLKAIDWLGSFAIIGATLSLLLGLEFGGVIFAWDSIKIIALLVIGFAMSIFFLINEKRWAAYPVMPLRLFQSRSNVAALIVGFLHGITYFSATYYLPLYAQSVLGLSPLHSGLFVLPFETSLSLTSGVSGLLIKLTGHYTPQIYIGVLLLTLSLTLLSIFTKIHTPSIVLVIIQLLGGAGTGLSYTPPLLALQAGILVKDNATATGTFRFTRELATAISIVLGGVVFQNAMQSHQNALVADVGGDVAELFTGKVAAANVLLIAGLEKGKRDVVREAYAAALRKMWLLFVGTGAGAFIAGCFVTRRSLSKVHEEGTLGLDVKNDGAEVPLQAGDLSGR